MNVENQKDGEYYFHIQYEFPSSGCISLEIKYMVNENKVDITDFSTHVPPADKEFVVVNINPEVQFGEINVGLQFGVDSRTQEYTKAQDIIANPNTLKMLDLAIADLSKAEILGKCRLAAPIGSDLIPCCNSTNNSKKKVNLFLIKY